MIIVAGVTQSTIIYDPFTNTATSGPQLGTSASTGAHSIQRPDGKYLIILGNTLQTTVVYDPGWVTSGIYESEFIYNPTLTSKSAFMWSGNADAYKQGVVSVQVRTATTTEGMATTTWRTIGKSGDLINPNSGDLWMQVRITMQRVIPAQLGSQKNVYLSSGSVVYNRLPLYSVSGAPDVNLAETFIQPVISSYSVMNVDSSDLATFAVNGSNVFRFSASGNAYTSAGGSWNSGGADVAEYFPTNDDTLLAGDIVSIDKNGQSSAITTGPNAGGYITKSTEMYDDNIIGVITTTPGVQLGVDIAGGRAGKQPVALVGRVPVRASNENGVVKKGDYLTSSTIDGVAMNGTSAGRVIGIALDDVDVNTIDGKGISLVLVYVNPHEHLGDSFLAKGRTFMSKKISKITNVIMSSLAELNIFVADNGNVGLGVANPESRFQVAGDITLGTPSVDGVASAGGKLVFHNDENDFTTTLKSASSTENIAFTLPQNLGTSGQALLTDENGNMYWGTVAHVSTTTEDIEGFVTH